MTPIWAVSLSVCAVRFWLLWITSRYILYIHSISPIASAVVTCTRTRVHCICMYVRVYVCVYVRTCVCTRRKACVYCVHFSVCVCVRVTHNHVLARTHHGNSRLSRRDGLRNGAFLLVRAPLASITCRTTQRSAPFYLFFLFFPLFFFLDRLACELLPETLPQSFSLVLCFLRYDLRVIEMLAHTCSHSSRKCFTGNEMRVPTQIARFTLEYTAQDLRRDKCEKYFHVQLNNKDTICT